jgi:nucleotidyltransferase/DNA polymerase involved in DNA repair
VARWVLHVDLDQFIAAVEVLRRPELAGRPVVVGGDGDPTKRGVVATASYEARRFGVHSGLALRTAARRCPDAVFLPVDREAYEAVSERVMNALRRLDAVVEVMGWDEAFLAVDSEDPEAVARQIQDQVKAATELNCTVGIGQNKLQAKLATGFGKPDPHRADAGRESGPFILTSQNWFAVMGDRPTDALWGIGAKTAAKLRGLSIATVNQLANASPRSLAAEFGPMIGPWLVQLAHGIDLSQVTAEPYVPRGHGREVTFQRDITDWAQVQAEVSRISGMVAADVAADGRPAGRIVVKVRYAPFFTSSHGVSLTEPTRDPDAIEQASLAALSRFTRRTPVRLLGVRAEFADS